jgi:CHAT domain-containing protein
VARARGDLAAARDEYEAAILSIEQTQSRLATELRSAFLEDKLQIYEDAIDCCLRLGDPGGAFAYLERAKSRALVDYLASNPEVGLRAPAGEDRELVDELARLRAEHNWFYERLHGRDFAVQHAEALPPAEAEALQAAIDAREKQIRRALERLALRRADVDGLEGLAGSASAGGAALAALPALDAGSVLLEYFLGRERSAVFVVRDGAVTAVPLAATRQDVRRLLDRLQLNWSSAARALAGGESLAALAANARAVLRALYQALVAPAAGWLAGCRRVTVIPYGVAHAVPFHALFDGRQHLIEQVEVVVCPSSGLLQLCAGRPRPAAPGTLVLAYSDGGRLPYVLREAEVVAAAMPGECYVEGEATRARLVEAAPRHGVIHLAAHGEARLDNPTFAHLKLADGQLSTADVFNLPLEGALVTLSACETGRSLVRGGDELIGLSRGFLYAGVSALVQSLWRVDDESTARLMARFYHALRAGRTRAAALRGAQLDLLTGGQAHPFIWAPFQLVGDG